MNGFKNGTVSWEYYLLCYSDHCFTIVCIFLFADSSRNEVDKLQQHLALLKEEYVKLQTVHNDLERKYALLSATSGETSENSYVLRLVKIVNGLFDNPAYRYSFNSSINYWRSTIHQSGQNSFVFRDQSTRSLNHLWMLLNVDSLLTSSWFEKNWFKLYRSHLDVSIRS